MYSAIFFSSSLPSSSCFDLENVTRMIQIFLWERACKSIHTYAPARWLALAHTYFIIIYQLVAAIRHRRLFEHIRATTTTANYHIMKSNNKNIEMGEIIGTSLNSVHKYEKCSFSFFFFHFTSSIDKLRHTHKNRKNWTFWAPIQWVYLAYVIRVCAYINKTAVKRDGTRGIVCIRPSVRLLPWV